MTRPRIALATRVADEVDERHGVAAGELRIGDEHVELEELVEEQAETRGRVRGSAHLEAARLEGRAEEAENGRIVVEEERPGPPDVRRVHALQTPLREGLFSL